MIELLLNVKPFQVKIDTGVVGRHNCNFRRIFWKLDGVTLRETGKSLHCPAKQPPANNALTIHWHDYYSRYIEISKLKWAVLF